MDLPFDPHKFDVEAFKANNVHSFFGLPDSSLSGLVKYFSATKPVSEHIITANEGAAVALAAGYYLSTRKIAVVYMQNSGLANALNPLQSSAVKEVFGIPMLLVIGWRGMPGEKDELQHALVGPHLLENLKANDIPSEVIPATLSSAKDALTRLIARSVLDKTPVALLVPSRTFSEYNIQSPRSIVARRPSSNIKFERWVSPTSGLPLSRELAIRCLLRHLKDRDVTVSSLGGNSRELFMILKERGESMARNFFCIGAMGHAFAHACGITVGFSSGRVFCIDGDGSFLMHIGNNAVLTGVLHPKVIHVVIYNGTHSSTGNHPLMISKDNFLAIAESMPHKKKFLVNTAEGLGRACEAAGDSTLVIVCVNDFVRKDLPRPSQTPQESKNAFMEHLARVGIKSTL